ncbi:SpoIIE family protein phosphatase [Deltaproteobacteria bacterium TL4]
MLSIYESISLFLFFTGAGIIGLSIVQTFPVLNWLKGEKSLKIWKIILLFLVFFFLTYSCVSFLLWRHHTQEFILLIGFILGAGSLFLYTILSLGRNNIQELKLADLKRQEANDQLIKLNYELEQRAHQRSESLKKNQQDLYTINEITREVSSYLELDQATQIFIERTVNALRPDGSGSILLHNGKDDYLEIYASYGLDSEHAKRFRVKLSAETLYTYEVFVSQRSKIFERKELKKFQTEGTLRIHRGREIVQQMVIPLISKRKSIGLINISHYSPSNRFNQSDQFFLENLAHSLSHHFENASLYEDSLKKEQEITSLYQQTQKELDLAAEFQRATLPSFKDLAFLKINPHYLPYGKVSGDIYEIYYNREGALNIFIGDATGHGVAAAFMTMMITIGLGDLRADLPTDTVLRRLNALLALRETGGAMTGLYFRITPGGELKLSNAGHYPLIILPADGSDPLLFQIGGCPLGMFADEPVPFIETSHQLVHEDKIIVFTDGIIEWENAKAEQFGMARVLHFLKQYQQSDVHALMAQLLEEIRTFAEETPQSDDVTLLGFQYMDPSQTQ